MLKEKRKTREYSETLDNIIHLRKCKQSLVEKIEHSQSDDVLQLRKDLTYYLGKLKK